MAKTKTAATTTANAEIINRLRFARDIARTCYAGAEAAHFNFLTPEAHKLAREDYAGFKQHVELCFSRWDAALQDFDKIIDAELWERIELAARNLEPLEIAGFKFATAHQVARQALQWWLNLRTVWEIECKAADDFAKMKTFPKGSPVAKLTKKELAALIKRRQVEDCVELLEYVREDRSCLKLSPSLGIDARIVKECKLAEHEAEKRDRSQTDSELKAEIRKAAKHLQSGLNKKNQILKYTGGNRTRMLRLIDEVRAESAPTP